MFAKKYLLEYRLLHERIQQLQLKLETLMIHATVSTSRIRAVMVSGTPKRDSLADKTLDIMDYKDKLTTAICDAEEAMACRELLIKKLPTKEMQELCKLRYFSNLQWREIAKIMGYSERKVYMLHSDAIIRLSEILSKWRGF